MEALEGVEGAVLLCDGSVDGVETLPATGCIHVPDRHAIHSPDVVSFALPVESLDPPPHAILFFLTLQPSTLQIDTEDTRYTEVNGQSFVHLVCSEMET